MAYRTFLVAFYRRAVLPRNAFFAEKEFQAIPLAHPLRRFYFTARYLFTIAIPGIEYGAVLCGDAPTQQIPADSHRLPFRRPVIQVSGTDSHFKPREDHHQPVGHSRYL